MAKNITNNENKIYDVVVIGGGIMGVCTAWALSKSKMCNVTLLDCSPLPRKNGGASGDYNRAIRYLYGTQEGYLLMVSDAYKAWDELFQDLGQSYYSETGFLAVMSNYPNTKISNEGGHLAADKSNWAMDSYNTMKKHENKINATVEYIEKENLTKYHPFLNTEDLQYGVYTKTGGVLHSVDIVENTVKWLKKQTNVTILEGPEYEAIAISTGNGDENVQNNNNSSTANEKHKVMTKSGVFWCDKLVLATGIYTHKLLPEVAKNKWLIPSRQQTAYYITNKESQFGWESYPMIIENNSQASFYIFPFKGSEGTPGMKASDRRFTLESDYDNEDFMPYPNFNGPTTEWLNHRFIPSSVKDLKVSDEKICYYDLSPGEIHQFYVFGQNTSAISVFGFTGHGFKFGSIYGKAIADTLLKKKSPESVKAWFAGEIIKTYDEL